MSGHEDSELQELVKQTLEKTGCLAKVRAELRAQIFLALDENDSFKNTNAVDNNLKAFASKPEGMLMINLLRDFLNCFGLSFTASVLDPELASCGFACKKLNRNELIEQLDIPSVSDTGYQFPLIHELLLKSKASNKKSDKLDNSTKSSRRVFDESISSLVAQDSAPLNLNTTYTSNVRSDNTDFEDRRNLQSSPISRKERANLSRSSLLSLEDLPPLTSPVSEGKHISNSIDVAPKQIMKLKAMLIDSSSDIVSDEEILRKQDDKESDLEDFNEENVLKRLED